MAPRAPESTETPAEDDLSEPAEAKVFRSGTVALIGRPNVGKSTLLNTLLGERIAIVSHHPQTTRDRIAGIVTTDDAQLVFLDTPGVHTAKSRLGKRMNELASQAAIDCDVAIFVTDVEAKPEPRVREVDAKILASVPEGKPVLVVLNKIDRVRQKDLLFPVLEAYGKARDVAAIVPVSALKGDGVPRIVKAVSELLPEGPPLHDPDEISDKPLRFFVAEFVREQILRRTRQEVPHGVAVTVDAFEDGKKQTRIAVTVHVAKDSHKGIIIGDGGRMLRDIGTAARQRAERLLGAKVHLETFVKANPRWFDDPKQLAELGYQEGAPAKKKSGGAAKKTANGAKGKRPKSPNKKSAPKGATSR